MFLLNMFKNWYVRNYNNNTSGDKVAMIFLTGFIILLSIGILWLVAISPALWAPFAIVVFSILAFFYWIFNEKD